MFGVDAISELIETVGYIGIFSIVFIESGIFVGFFLPGDSLLFTAGFLASQNILNIWLLIPLIITAAVLGDSVGYWLGRKAGALLFTREDSFWFSKKRIEDARRFSDRYGTKAIIIARFVPAVRTFIPIIAGVGNMHYNKFLMYNIIGAILWGGGVTLFGYFLGNVIPHPDRYLLPLVGFIILMSFIPVLREYLAFRTKK